MLHAASIAGHARRALLAGNPASDALASAGSGVGDVIRALRGRGIVSAAELQAIGVSRQYASQLRQRGILERVAHGQSRLAPRFDPFAT